MLGRAGTRGVPAVGLPISPDESRAAYDARLAAVVACYEPTWVVLAGWMRLLRMAFLGRFPNRVVNLHPALPGAFPGTHAIARAFEAARAGGSSSTGVMIHLVPDEGVDDGPVLASRSVAILPTDELADLEARIHVVEHGLLVTTLASLCDGSHSFLTSAAAPSPGVAPSSAPPREAS